MAFTRSFLLLDATGTPLTTATPTFVEYRDRAGASRTQPAAPTHVGGGLYAYTPSDTDESTGTVALIDGGASAFPRRVAQAIYLPTKTNQFFAWHLEDFDGNLWTAAAPTVGAYVSKTGSPLSAPPVVAAAGAYLFTVTPAAADLQGQVVARLDNPDGAAVAFYVAASEPTTLAAGVMSPTSGLSPEGIAVKYLVEWLRLWLPAKCAELNLLRAATLTTPGFGTGTNVGWTITSGMQLRVSASRDAATATVVTLPTGAAVTAATIATAINSTPVPGVTASADALGRLVLTSNTPPADPSTNSVVAVHADGTGGAKALGWEAGGEFFLVAPLRPPAYRGIMDGYPVTGPDANAGMWIILGQRASRSWPQPGAELRRGETETTIPLEIFRSEVNLSPSHNREAITACVRAVRELLEYGDGRYLGRAGAGDVTRVIVGETAISPRAFNFTDLNTPNVFHDVASLTVTIRTFQRTQ